MRRYEGLLRPISRPAPWPARWIIIATEGTPIPCAERAGIRQTGLARWSARILEMRRERVYRYTNHAGAAAADAWRLVAEAAGSKGLTWVMSPRALYDWTLLGLWERILLGDIVVANDDPACRRQVPDRGLARPPGMMLVADPPSAAALLVGAERRRVTWVCATNYGWQYGPDPDGAAGIVAGLARDVAWASEALAQHHLGGWSPTIGRMAERAWRSRYMHECIYVDVDMRAQQLLRDAVFGGRMCVRLRGYRCERAYHVDARGSYGHISYRQPLPVGLRCIGRRLNPDRLRRRDTAIAMVASVVLRRGQGRYPVREDGEVSYPDGACRAVLSGPELEDAIKRDLVSAIGSYAEYHLGSPLRDVQAACYAMRCQAEREGRPAVAALAKAMAVAVIGKLHSYEEMWEECMPDYNDPICGTWLGPDGRGGQTEYRAVAGLVSRRRRQGLAAMAYPAIPVWVWSYGRQWLLERIEAAGWEHVIYAHTDGLVVSEEGYQRLVDRGYIYDQVWGQLRHVAGPVDAEVLGPLCVRVGDELIEPGRPRDQRGREYVEEGYWFRRPFGGGAGPWEEGIWEEQYRNYST